MKTNEFIKYLKEFSNWNRTTQMNMTFWPSTVEENKENNAEEIK